MKKHRPTKRQRRIVEANGWVRIKRSKGRPVFCDFSEMTLQVGDVKLVGVKNLQWGSSSDPTLNGAVKC